MRPGDIEALETAEIGRRVPSGANRLVGEIVLKSRAVEEEEIQLIEVKLEEDLCPERIERTWVETRTELPRWPAFLE